MPKRSIKQKLQKGLREKVVIYKGIREGIMEAIAFNHIVAGDTAWVLLLTVLRRNYRARTVEEHGDVLAT